jgi:oligopeptide transport system substrate-binding protein
MLSLQRILGTVYKAVTQLTPRGNWQTGFGLTKLTSGRCCMAGLFAVLTLVGIPSLWAKGPTQADQAISQGVLLKGNGADPATLDPQLASGYPELHVLLALGEGLCSLHPDTLEPIPAVASHWDISSDGLTYTFYLRPEARWSNGQNVVAQDFVYACQRALSPQLACPNAGFVMGVKGARAYHDAMLQGQRADFAWVGIVALDDHTLRICLEQPTPHLLSMLTHPVWYPVYRPALEATGDPFSRANAWAQPGTFVGNGPFLLKSWQLADRVVVLANPYYWDKDQVALKGIHFVCMQDADTEEKAFRSGQLHLTESCSAAQKIKPAAQLANKVQHVASLGTWCYSLNTTRPPFDDVRVRQALSLALDRKLVCAAALGAHTRPAYTFVPPGLAGYTCSQPVQEDLAQAKVLLAQAGYPEGKGFPEVRLLYNSSPSNQTLAQAVQALWHERLGIRITLVAQEWKVFLDSRRKKDFEISRASWMGDYLYPTTFLDIYRSQDANNHAGWQHPAYDAALDRAALSTDAAERLQHMDAAEALLLQEAPVLTVGYMAEIKLKDPRLKGWRPTACMTPYRYLYFED